MRRDALRTGNTERRVVRRVQCEPQSLVLFTEGSGTNRRDTLSPPPAARTRRFEISFTTDPDMSSVVHHERRKIPGKWDFTSAGSDCTRRRSRTPRRT